VGPVEDPAQLSAESALPLAACPAQAAARQAARCRGMHPSPHQAAPRANERPGPLPLSAPGFSLIELIEVLAIIAILALMAVDRSTVQEDKGPAVSTNLKVQPNVSVLEGRQCAPCRRNPEAGSLHRLP